MEFLKLYTEQNCCDLISTRAGETKFGEKIQFVSALEDLKNISANYVLFGIPEDIGVRANYGKPGASSAWKAFLPAFLNIQANAFNTPENCVLLGEVACDHWMQLAAKISPQASDYHSLLGELVAEIDEVVYKIVTKIIENGKIPVIVGGGHNNAFGNIKGASTALKTPINVLNIDAHTDLRTTGIRHSGNGFSQALEDGFLDQYFIFGLHENYTSEAIFKQLRANEKIGFMLYEELISFPIQQKQTELNKACDFLQNRFGLEIDCDSIAGFESSAMTPSGFAFDELRSFLRLLSKYNPYYLHLCEASAENSVLVGKALAYLVSDFFKEKVK